MTIQSKRSKLIYSVAVFKIITLVTLLPTFAQAKKVDEIYKNYCVSCHGENLEGGMGGSLVDEKWQYITPERSVYDVIAKGIPDAGMEGFEETLSAEDIRSLVIYIREKTKAAKFEKKPPPSLDDSSPLATQHHTIAVETVVDDLDSPWALDFLPNGNIIFTEKKGELKIFDPKTEKTTIVKGTPKVHVRGQGGLLDVMPHPDYERNGWIYLSFNHGIKRKDKTIACTKIVRGRIVRNEWKNEKTIFEADTKFYTGRPLHFGSRFAFDPEGYLYFPIGDRGEKARAQDLDYPNGKVYRVNDDGTIPSSNPFFRNRNAIEAIWSYGHRNPQGMACDPVTGNIWSAEHGPRGGDELNLIRKSENYGWPIVTYGMNYNGTPITSETSRPEFIDPKHHWTPSIAVSSISFYTGAPFPKWKNDLFIGSLSQKELWRFKIQGDTILEKELVFKGLGRIRDIQTGPDGFLYLAMNGPNSIVRIYPSK